MIRALIEKVNPMLVDLIVGCCIYGVLGEAVLTGIYIILGLGGVIKAVAGMLIGVLAMIGLTIHMTFSIEVSLTLDEQGALKHTRKMYMVRIAIILIILFVIYFTGVCNAITFVIGMLSLKVAAYLQPITNKYITSKFLSKGR